MTTRVDFPVTKFSACIQCRYPIRRENVPWSNQWLRVDDESKRCVTMIGCIPEK